MEGDGWFERYREAIFVGAVFFIVAITFFVMLSAASASQAGPGEPNQYSFGFTSVLFALIIGVLAGTFLVWLKGFIKTRPYLGLIIGMIVIASVISSFKYRFEGPYTTLFQILIGLLSGGYIVFYFIKFFKNAGKSAGETFDDS